VNRLFLWLDDRLNPIAVKELRQAVRSRLIASALVFFVAVELVVLGVGAYFVESEDPNDVDFYAGRRMFLIINGVMVAACMVLIPLYTGVRLALEHRESSSDLFFISTLSPRGIVFGKMLSGLMLCVLIMSACVPFLMFTYLLRGVDFPSMMIVLAVDVLALLLGIQFAVLVGSVPGNIALKAVLFIPTVIALAYLTAGCIAVSLALLLEGLRISLDSTEFLAMVGATIFGVISTLILWFSWSVALLSAPSSNRMFQVRVVMTTIWILTTAIAAWASYEFETHELTIAWMSHTLGTFGFMFLIAINERESWGPRVAKSIPSNPLLKLPAFLFFTGSGGGITLACLCIGLAFTGAVIWHAVTPATWRGTRFFPAMEEMLVVSLYMYSYCMAAVFLRSTIFRHSMKPTFTWSVALLLGGLGCVMPVILGYLFFQDQLRYGYYRDNDIAIWLFLPNPVVTLQNMNSYYSSELGTFSTPPTIVISLVAVFLTAINLPWYISQVRRFQRYESTPMITESVEDDDLEGMDSDEPSGGQLRQVER
jgi:hypothetical protein